MQTVNITYAKANLSRLLKEVELNGEEILLMRNDMPVAKISKYDNPKPKRRLGAFKGKIKLSKDFDKWPDDIAVALGIKDGK